jgi:light-regulated signal transduction histidine kinase (bacteriophytochrome)
MSPGTQERRHPTWHPTQEFHARADGQVEMRLETTGHKELVFRIFQRLHTRKQYPGTGIELAVCKRIVQHHGGRLRVESQSGQGSHQGSILRARSCCFSI